LFKEPDMTRILFAGAATLALLAGCAHSAPPVAAAPAPKHAGAMMALCPMSVPGTTVTAADEENGSTITFSTTADQVAELQRRVHDMVKMHNQHHGEGGMKHEGMMEGGMMGGGKGMSGMMMPSSHATVLDLETGARIKVMPSDPADLHTLQGAVRMHAQRMQKDGCGMMGEMHAG
jgi:hypothetical protein